MPHLFVESRDLPMETMPSHWLFARMGKRVMPPGGAKQTKSLLNALAIGSDDRVVELEASLGQTSLEILACLPKEFTAVESDQYSAAFLSQMLSRPGHLCLRRPSHKTGIPSASADVVLGEGFLSTQSMQQKIATISEAKRLLKTRGRFGLHELCFRPDDISDGLRSEIQQELSRVIRSNLQILSSAEWEQLLREHGFAIHHQARVPMTLLEPSSLIHDEGIWGAARFIFKTVTNTVARQRIRSLRSLLNKYRPHLSATTFTAEKV